MARTGASKEGASVALQGRPGALQGTPGASQDSLGESQGRPGTSQGPPRGSLGKPQGCPGSPRGLPGTPGTPRDFPETSQGPGQGPLWTHKSCKTTTSDRFTSAVSKAPDHEIKHASKQVWAQSGLDCAKQMPQAPNKTKSELFGRLRDFFGSQRLTAPHQVCMFIYSHIECSRST